MFLLARKTPLIVAGFLNKSLSYSFLMFYFHPLERNLGKLLGLEEQHRLKKITSGFGESFGKLVAFSRETSNLLMHVFVSKRGSGKNISHHLQ